MTLFKITSTKSAKGYDYENDRRKAQAENTVHGFKEKC